MGNRRLSRGRNGLLSVLFCLVLLVLTGDVYAECQWLYRLGRSIYSPAEVVTMYQNPPQSRFAEDHPLYGLADPMVEVIPNGSRYAGFESVEVYATLGGRTYGATMASLMNRTSEVNLTATTTGGLRVPFQRNRASTLEEFVQRFEHNLRVSDLVRLGETGGRVLVLGCGEGTLVNELRKIGIDAYGVDYMLPPYLMDPNQPASKYFAIADAKLTGIREGQFDVVIMDQWRFDTSSLGRLDAPTMYRANHAEQLAQVNRILPEGGVVLMTTYQMGIRNEIWHKDLPWYVVAENYNPAFDPYVGGSFMSQNRSRSPVRGGRPGYFVWEKQTNPADRVPLSDRLEPTTWQTNAAGGLDVTAPRHSPIWWPGESRSN